MVTQKIPFNVVLRQYNNTKLPDANGKWFAYPYLPQTLTTSGLANHLIKHGVIAESAEVEEILLAMAECIPELLAQGKGVKLGKLGIFRPTIESTGAEQATKFNPNTDIEGVHIRFFPDQTNLDNKTSKMFRKQCTVNVIGYETAGQEGDSVLHLF